MKLAPKLARGRHCAAVISNNFSPIQLAVVRVPLLEVSADLDSRDQATRVTGWGGHNSEPYFTAHHHSAAVSQRGGEAPYVACCSSDMLKDV